MRVRKVEDKRLDEITIPSTSHAGERQNVVVNFLAVGTVRHVPPTEQGIGQRRRFVSRQDRVHSTARGIRTPKACAPTSEWAPVSVSVSVYLLSP